MSRYPFRTALVTGASSGIGEEMVRLLSADGVGVIAVARRREKLEALRATCPGVEPLTADLVTAAGLRDVAARLANADRPVELLVNNAGFGSYGTFSELDADRLDDEIALNVRALTRLARAAAAPMSERGRGWILNVSSIAGFQPGPRLSVYAATKAYVTSLSESLHEELGPAGVRVTALCPGLTRTEFQQVSGTESFADAYPAVAWLTARDVAAAGLRDASRGRAISVPGWQYKLMTTAVDVSPRGLVRRLSGALLNRR
jgi:hypothetical protein